MDMAEFGNSVVVHEGIV